MNTTEEVHIAADENAGNSSQGFPPFPQPPPLSLASIVVGLITGATGMCANAVVFVVLVSARRHFGHNVNTLIANQSAMDLCACIFLTISFGLTFPGAPQNYMQLGQVGNNIVCFLLRNRVLSIASMNAAKIGLVVITLERYIKVVHAVLHRKHYRPWMTRVAVALPWISGLGTFVIPALVSTRAVPGQCPMMGFWPSKDGEKVFGAFDFVWHYALPVTIFAYCYSHIFHVVKRHRKIVCIHVANAAAASRDGNTLQIQQQATGATTASPKLSRIQLNILETMIAVIVCFIVCWTPSSLTNIVQSITMQRSLPNEWMDIFAAFGFINLCLNPMIYAARYEMFKKSARRMLNIDIVAPTIGPSTI